MPRFPLQLVSQLSVSSSSILLRQWSEGLDNEYLLYRATVKGIISVSAHVSQKVLGTIEFVVPHKHAQGH